MVNIEPNTQKNYSYTYIHNVFANFYRDSLDYFTTHVYPRFEYSVIATYEKAVEYISKTDQYNREIDKPLLPALILNPSGDFGLADTNAGGNQLWRFPNLAPGLIKRISPPIYQDQQVIITPGYLRLKGEIELIMLLNSFYEYCDIKILLLQIFGGMERWIYPFFFSSFIILPDELVNYRYTNEYTGLTYKLDWESAGAVDQLVKTTDINELVVPCSIRPQYKLMGISDGSTKYGGDKLAEWRLTATLEYEVEIPHFLLLESDYLVQEMNLEVRYGSCFSEYANYKPPVNREINDFSQQFGIDATSSTVIIPTDATSSEPEFIGEFIYKTRYFHVITKSESESTINITIDLPEQISDERTLIVNSKSGQLAYGDHFVIDNDGWDLTIKVDNVPLVESQIIELYVYERMT